MDSSYLSKSLRRNWLLIVVITLIVGLVSWAFDRSQPKKEYGVMSITVQSSQVYPASSQLILNSVTSADVKLLSDTLNGWLSDPSFVNDVMSASDIGVDGGVKTLAQLFKVSSNTGGVVQVQYIGKTHDEDQKVLDALQAHLSAAMNDYNSKSSNVKGVLTFSNELITDVSDTVPLVPIAGVAIGFIFALVVVALTDRKRN